ncbi:fungal-specific transcription factor domain-containing protein [Aspergillus pseudoustus]|uniref:Fungal-specific transcription factor domain-containing protein n=1 Tax=Aspergillus pseudoustus TaxID=1810923 RepID=A0ABR4KHY0_9EURO
MNRAETRKRRRPAKACEPCRQRKVRCDLKQPCGPCTRSKSSVNCSYRDEAALSKQEGQFRVQRRPAVPPPPQPGGIGPPDLTPSSIGGETATPNDDLRQTVRELQERLDGLEARVTRGETRKVSSTQNSRLENDVRALTDRLQTVQNQLTSSSSAATVVSASDRTAIRAIAPHLRHSARKVKFLGPSHWCHKVDKLSISQLMTTKEPPEPALDNVKSVLKECRDLRQSIKSQRSVKLSDPFPNVRSTLPSRGECDELMQCYLRTFEPIYRVIHVPSFWAEYDEFWGQPRPNLSPFLAKLVLILAIGTVFRSGEGSLAREEYQQLAQIWIYAAQWWLAGPSEKSTCNLDGLQVSCLLLISRKACGLGPSPWLSAGSLMKMAMAMGLHRDPSNFPSLSPFQAEIRRRLWATVLELELQESLDLSLPCLVPPTVDTKAPLNIDDRLWTPDSTTMPHRQPNDEVTPASIQTLLYITVKLRMQVLEVIHHCQEQSYQRALDLGSQLRAACRKAAAFFSSANTDTDAEVESCKFQAKFIDIQLHRYILALHTPFVVQARKDPQYYFARKACLDSVATMAAYANALNLPADAPDDICRLFVSGKGSFKGPLSLDVIGPIGLELVTQLEEEYFPGLDGDPLDKLAGAGRDHLIETLEHILRQLFQIIAMGTPSMKRFGLTAAVLGQIRAMKAGRDIKGVVYEAVIQSFKDCLLALQMSSQRTEAMSGLDSAATAVDFGIPDPTLPGFDMDLTDSIFGLDFQALFPFPGIDNSMSTMLS